MSKLPIKKAVEKGTDGKQANQKTLSTRKAKNMAGKERIPKVQFRAISPHTKLPEEHPESQAVERARYDMQLSLNNHPDRK